MPGHAVAPLMPPPLLQPLPQLLGAPTPLLCSGCKNLQLDSKRHQPLDLQCLHTMALFSVSLITSESSFEVWLVTSGAEAAVSGEFGSIASVLPISEEEP